MMSKNSILNKDTLHFLKSLGFPSLTTHEAKKHFDFVKGGRRILVIGPMGSGKTEYSARVWRDAAVLKKKSEVVSKRTTKGIADRRNVFFLRSLLDAERFKHYPKDALAYRGGYERCGEQLAFIRDSFDLEEEIKKHPEAGTWIIDEATFYDERLPYVMRRESEINDLIFIFPTLILNFRRDIFNSTARLLLENSTDVIPLTAYCEHPDCVRESFYTYRYYTVDDKECPALYFDPLIIIGGDQQKHNPLEPDYCTRCDYHHYLPAKEYTYFSLKPLGQKASEGDWQPLFNELKLISRQDENSLLYQTLYNQYIDIPEPQTVNMNSLNVPCIAEKALVFLSAEENLISSFLIRDWISELGLNEDYLRSRMADNRRIL